MSFRRSCTYLMTAAGLLWFSVDAAAQGAASTVIVTAPSIIVVSGEQMRLEALARDSQGIPRRNDTFTFTSANPSIATVDSTGTLTARGLGVVNVTARTGNVTSPAVSIQVLPWKVDVVADRQWLKVGDTLQFKAIARDINGLEIPAVNFTWMVTTANGGTNTRAATIDSTGKFTALGIGVLPVRARIPYSIANSAQLTQFDGLTYISIFSTHEFKLTRLLTNSPIDGSHGLRPVYNGDFAANDRGQIAFAGNIDGLTTALLLYDNGRFNVLASAGTPGILGGYVWNFEGPPAINNRGEVVSRFGTRNGWGLIRASALGTSFIMEGGSEGAFQSLGYFRVGRQSINDNGDIAFLADFQFAGSTTRYTGLFILKDGSLQSVWTTVDPLPGFPASFIFDNSMFGIDRTGVAYFRVFSGSNSAIYRADGTSEPRKIAGTGVSTGNGTIVDPQGLILAAKTIQDVYTLTISPDGVAGFSGRFTDGTVVVGRWRSSGPSFLPVNRVDTVYSINDSGEVLYLGNPATGAYGPWRWGTQNIAVLDFSVPLEGGERPSWVRAGKITPSGEAILSLDSAENRLLVVRASSTTRTLWKGNTSLNVQANLNFQGLLPGASSGSAHIFTGGSQAAIMEVLQDGVRPVWAPGDRPIEGFTNFQMTSAAKTPNGTLYMTTSDGILRYSSGRVEAVQRFPFEKDSTFIRGTANWWDGSNGLAANDSGAYVFNSFSDSFGRLMLYANSQWNTIMIQGGANQTASPSGGVFGGILGSGRQSSVLIDSRNRVLVNAFVNGGRSGLFVYESGRWRAIALIGQTVIEGSVVSGILSFRTDGQSFYASMNLASGGFVIAKFNEATWDVLVRRLDYMPDGTELTGLTTYFAVNSGGDIAFGAYSTIQKIILRTADGVNHIVYTEMDATNAGDRLISQNYEFDLRDDRKLYFIGLDSLDRNMVYLAEPEP